MAKRLGRKEACISLGSLYLICAVLLLGQSFMWPYIPLSLAMFGHSIHSFYLGELLRWSHLALRLSAIGRITSRTSMSSRRHSAMRWGQTTRRSNTSGSTHQ